MGERRGGEKGGEGGRGRRGPDMRRGWKEKRRKCSEGRWTVARKCGIQKVPVRKNDVQCSLVGDE